ncbi:MAG: hypothetical protein GY835_23745 [bacterium]|nr:hypothetical protein [bacterium]
MEDPRFGRIANLISGNLLAHEKQIPQHRINRAAAGLAQGIAALDGLPELIQMDILRNLAQALPVLGEDEDEPIAIPSQAAARRWGRNRVGW